MKLLRLLLPNVVPNDDAVLLRERIRLSSATGRRKSLRLILARSAIRIKHLDLSSVPLAEHINAARSQAIAWAPFDRTDACYVVGVGRAIVFGWDADRTAELMRQHGLESVPVTAIPEPLLCEPPEDATGVRLLQCLEGFEAQHWQDKWLHASRWWPSLPTQTEWSHFCRAASLSGLPAETAVPAPVTAVRLRRPWAVARKADFEANQSARIERWLVGGVGLVLVAATAGHARQAWQLDRAQAELSSERDGLLVSVRPVLAQRDTALALSAAVNRAAAGMASTDPLDVMQYLTAVLPRDGVILKELGIEGRNIRIVLQVGGAITRASLVTAIQSSGMFNSVSESTEGVQAGWVGFSMRLVDGSAAAASSARLETALTR